MSTTTLLAASDGGANTTQATFGWTLQNHNTEVASCYGPVHGSDPTAFRAEATGLLSLVCFLHNLLTHYHWPFHSSTPPLHIHLDNQSLLRIVTQPRHCSFVSPSTTVSSKYNLISQIQSILLHLPLTIQFHHVRSHQDRTAPDHTLSLPAQANCRADQLATNANEQCTSHPSAPLYPASQCRLNIHNKTITRRLFHSLHHHTFANTLKRYIIKSRSWEDETALDWSLFSSICLQQSTRLNFYIKWIHRCLPVGSVLHIWNPSSCPFCPACGERETHIHFLTCCHPSRLPLKQRLITQLRKHLSSINTDPSLKLILLESINQLLTGQSPSLPAHTSPYYTLAQSQSTIGWHNLLRGFLSTEWCRLHDLYLKRSHLPPHASSTHPYLSLLTTIIADIHSIWKFRSAQRHSADLALHESECLRQAKQQITDLYQFKSSVLPTDRSIFKSNLQIHLKDNLSSLTAWIQNHSHYIHQSCKQARQLQVTIPITRYFSHTWSYNAPLFGPRCWYYCFPAGLLRIALK